MQTWRLDGPFQTLVLASGGGVPEVVYWGSHLPKGEDLTAVAMSGLIDVTGGMMDEVAPISLCPEASSGFPGQPGLIAYRDGALLQPRLVLVDADEGRFVCEDKGLGLLYEVRFQVADDVITAEAKLTCDEPVDLHHLAAPVLPGPQSGDILHLAGRWCGEFQTKRSPWQPGAVLREARTGRSGHEHPPLAFFCEEGATNTQGCVFGMHYGWSGGHRMVAEELPDGRRQIQWSHASGAYGRGTNFRSAPLYLARSETGLNGCAVAFQRHVRKHVSWPKPERPRPVHYNCWEAVYFDHDLATLKDIAARAADLGAERFVLDDGWFGKRDDDTASLGDWEIDRRKWPDGLTPLIDHVHGLGMTFGLWFEPEMINQDSDLYRAHPEWLLGRADQPLGRSQLVLDMARDDVRAHLFDKISAVLSSHDIDYIKWDHNRLLPVVDAAQTEGVYSLLADLRTAFPDVEIESCASGGGRIDLGILSHTQRVWLSDSNDALERLRIQHDAALLLPLGVTGSHVGPRVCHTSGRTLDIRFRAWVAAQRHLGFEMDPRELSDDEAEVLRNVTAWWKGNRDWMANADILRLDSHDPSVLAEQHLCPARDRFVVFAGKAAVSAQIAPRPLRLTGLDAASRYRIELVNRGEAMHLSRGKPVLKSEPITVSGAYLMQRGLTLPWRFPETMWVLQGQLA